MLDTAKVNMRTVAQLQELANEVVLKTREFTYELCCELVEPHIKRRQHIPGLQSFVKLAISAFFGKVCSN